MYVGTHVYVCMAYVHMCVVHIHVRIYTSLLPILKYSSVAASTNELE